MSNLNGKVALVTGSSRGIGRAIAIELAGLGAKVAVVYQNNADKANEVVDAITKAGGEAKAYQADIGVSEQARGLVKKVAEDLGRLDVLVNNAGITRDCTLKKMTDEQWEEVIQTNLNSYFYTTSAAAPIMMELGGGRIVNVSSMNGQIASFGQANYSASKGAIIAFTRTAALEFAKGGITVNTVAPGFTETDMLSGVAENIREQIVGRIPLRRFGKPEEIAKAVAFLVTDGDYITGQQINVNGGAHM